MGEDISDAELEAVALRVRRHRQRQQLARGAGVLVALLGLCAGIGAAFWMGDERAYADLAGKAFWIVSGIGAVCGAMVYRGLEPKGSLHDVE